MTVESRVPSDDRMDLLFDRLARAITQARLDHLAEWKIAATCQLVLERAGFTARVNGPFIERKDQP